ncbi:MAG: cation:dicarboxylase symporter family transporter [Sphingomonadales bacterium]|nr:cation:dicarboxylase symporter family transporter [Sphingomonadales bacterium]
MPEITVPTGWTLAALGAGLAAGLFLPPPVLAPLLAVAAPIGELWLKGLQMTILPLVVSLLVIGVVRTIEAARGGATARRTLGLIVAFLVGGAVMAALATPLLLALFPIPGTAATALSAVPTPAGQALPGVGAFLSSLVPDNVFASAAGGAVLPVIVFFALFAAALGRLPAPTRRAVLPLFEGVAAAMMIVIGWVLALAPIGVLALSLGVAAKTGAAAFAVLAHYIAVVSAVGGVVMLAGYALAVLGARLPLGAYARALLPVEAVALSTQSSLASLPAMLAACRRLGVRESSADFVLPLAVALFRATGPAMNLAVAIYVARLTGVALTPAVLAAGVVAASLTTLGAPSISGTVSYISSIGPIALAMGVPVAPLALLVAVEMLPDLMRTLGNVCMDVLLAATVDRWNRRDAVLQASGARDPVQSDRVL